MALDCSFQKWTAPFLANLSTEDASVLAGIFTSISAEFARHSKLIEELCAVDAANVVTIASLNTTIAAIQASLASTQALVATCCAGTTTTTPAPTTTTTAAPGATTTTAAPAPATTTTTVATTTTTVAPGPSCTECAYTIVVEYRCNRGLNGENWVGAWEERSGRYYDGSCWPVGCVGCHCPVLTQWNDWIWTGTFC